MTRFSAVSSHGRGTRYRMGVLLAIATLSVFMLAGSLAAQDAVPVRNLISFSSMLGDPGNGTPGAAARNVIRGYQGPPPPWIILGSITGVLKTNGVIAVTVRGLVLPNRINPVPFFRAALSCQSPTDSTKGRLFFTKPFPADASGNADIADTITMPLHCIAPIVLVTSPAVPGNAAGFWFAVTGK